MAVEINVKFHDRGYIFEWINGRLKGRPVWYGVKDGREVMLGSRQYRAYLKELMPMRMSFRLERLHRRLQANLAGSGEPR